MTPASEPSSSATFPRPAPHLPYDSALGKLLLGIGLLGAMPVS